MPQAVVPAHGAAVLRLLATASALLLQGCAVHAQPWLRDEQAGATYTVTRTVVSRGTGSSFDRDTLVERVVAVRNNGLELEYDLPGITTPQDRARQWQFPARVFKAADGSMRLLDQRGLENRVGEWLERAKLPRTACGHWYFTWNAFRIECDPQSVLRGLKELDLRPGVLGNGTTYTLPGAAGPAVLREALRGPGGATFTGEAAVDPEGVRRAQAAADVVAAEVNGKTLALEDALRARSAEQVSGTVVVTFETDPARLVRKRDTLTKLETRNRDGTTETRETTETVERRPAPARRP